MGGDCAKWMWISQLWVQLCSLIDIDVSAAHLGIAIFTLSAVRGHFQSQPPISPPFYAAQSLMPVSRLFETCTLCYIYSNTIINTLINLNYLVKYFSYFEANRSNISWFSLSCYDSIWRGFGFQTIGWTREAMPHHSGWRMSSGGSQPAAGGVATDTST